MVTKGWDQGYKLVLEMLARIFGCEHFPEVGVSRRGTANVLKCWVADAQLNYSLGLRESDSLQCTHWEYSRGKATFDFLGVPMYELCFH